MIFHFQEMIRQIPLSILTTTLIMLMIATPVFSRSKKCIRFPKLPSCRENQGDGEAGVVSAAERMRETDIQTGSDQEEQNSRSSYGGDVLCQSRPILCRKGKSAAAGKV